MSTITQRIHARDIGSLEKQYAKLISKKGLDAIEKKYSEEMDKDEKQFYLYLWNVCVNANKDYYENTLSGLFIAALHHLFSSYIHQDTAYNRFQSSQQNLPSQVLSGEEVYNLWRRLSIIRNKTYMLYDRETPLYTIGQRDLNIHWEPKLDVTSCNKDLYVGTESVSAKNKRKVILITPKFNEDGSEEAMRNILNENKMFNELKDCEHVVDAHYCFTNKKSGFFSGLYKEYAKIRYTDHADLKRKLPHCYLIQKYYPEGSLKSFIINKERKHPKLQLAEKLIHLVHSLHKEGFYHGDLKEDNIVVKVDSSGLKFAFTDLESTASIGASPIEKTQKFRHTPKYLPPELAYANAAGAYEDEKAAFYAPYLNDKYDVWCTGIVLLNLIFNSKYSQSKEDFSNSYTYINFSEALNSPELSERMKEAIASQARGEQLTQVVYKYFQSIVDEQFEKSLRKDDLQPIKELIQWMLTVDPDKRPSMQEVVNKSRGLFGT